MEHLEHCPGAKIFTLEQPIAGAMVGAGIRIMPPRYPLKDE